MDEKSLGFVNQLIEKTELGRLIWSTGFEDGQFKTILPGGELAFVIQATGEMRKFQMLDEHQEVILEDVVTRDEAQLDKIRGGIDRDNLYDAILKLQEMARSQALQVNQKLVQAEQLLNSI
jgi:hypothetical protein